MTICALHVDASYALGEDNHEMITIENEDDHIVILNVHHGY